MAAGDLVEQSLVAARLINDCKYVAHGDESLSGRLKLDQGW
jgi:hypothetical protein